MKACPHCNTQNADEHKFCQQCGRSLELAPLPSSPAEVTVRWSGQAIPSPQDLKRQLPVDALFGSKNRLVIGRSADCDVCLPHPTVSRRHAVLERVPEGLRLSDLGSVNGVSVGGQRAAEPILIKERERVGIGPFLFTLAGGVIHSLDNSRSLRLEARHLEKSVRLGDGQMRKLLENINLVVEPGEFVSLLGPSGSGKSTLMDCLNGRRRATGGKVLANGEDFYRHFDNFRQSLGYVPQKDIVHAQLTVYRALYYTAQLRLPTDTSRGELQARIEEVLQEMELQPHRDTLVANLSGGQIKRVSLGAELLARPCLLYIDEATSGLDAGTESRMMRLFRRLADEGKSIICITHNVDNVDRCHLALVLVRGKLIYYGPPAEAPAYFRVQRLSEIYDRLTEKDLATWEKDFTASSLYEEFVVKRLPAAPAASEEQEKQEKGVLAAPLSAIRSLLPELSSSLSLRPAAQSPDRPYRPPLWHQFRVLTARYAELMWSDRRSLRLLWLQAPLVALFVLAGFIHKPYQQTIPVLRKLTKKEALALMVVQNLQKSAVADEKEAPPSRVRVTAKSDTHQATTDVTQLVRMLRRTPLDRLDDEQRRRLEETEFTVEDGQGNSEKLTGAELIEEMKGLQQSQIPQKLLEAYEHDMPVVPDKEDIVNPRFTYMLLFILVIVVLWFGCNNAAKEIVKEEAIYGRERSVNLGILPYLASKFLVLSVVTAIQALVLMVMVYGTLELLGVLLHQDVPCTHYRLAYVPQFGVLVLLSMTGVALGLLLSACVANPDRANALLPYVLIPQIILGGGIMEVNKEPLHILAVLLSPVYWTFRAVHRGAWELPAYLPFHMDYDGSVWTSCVALLVQTALLLLATVWFLRRKDVRTA